MRAVTLDVDRAGRCIRRAAASAPGSADRVLMNPPFNDPARQNVSPDPGRRAAHAAPDGALGDWVDAAAWLLHSAGTLTLIWRADGLAECWRRSDGRFGGIAVLPVHGRAGQPAIRVLVRAQQGQPRAAGAAAGADAQRRRRASRPRRPKRCCAARQALPLGVSGLGSSPPQRRGLSRRGVDTTTITIDDHQKATGTGFSCSFAPVLLLRRDNAPRNSLVPAKLPAMC